MKRNLIIILVVLLAVVAAFIYFTKDDVVFSKETSLYKAVPVSAPVFVELSSLKAIPNENPVLQELAEIEEFAWFIGKIKEIDVSIKADDAIQKRLGKKPVIVALDFIGNNVLKPVIISQLKSLEELKGFEQLIGKLLSVPASSFISRKYDGAKIVDITFEEGKRTIHYCAVGGIVIISPESILVEKSIRQLNSQNITNISYFNKVNKTVTGQSDIAWYINHNKFPELWTNFLNGTTQTEVNEFDETVKTNLKRAIRGIRNYASWSELDMSFDENGIMLNGITAADDSLNNFLSVFEGQQPVSCDADRVLPKNTSFFMSFTFSDRELFFKNLESYFEHSNSYFQREGHIKTIEKQFRVDSRNTLRYLVKNRVLAAITSVSSQAGKKSTLFIVNTDSHIDTRASFEGMLQNYASSKDIDYATLLSEYQVGDGNTYRIYTFPYPSLPGIWLGKSVAFADAHFAAFWNDNLVFASSKEALQKYLSDMSKDFTLRSSKSYVEFKRDTESKANINAYFDVNKIYALNKYLFNTDFSKAFETNEEVFRKFDAFAWQVVCEKSIYFNSINLSFNSKPKTEARALWQSDIGAMVRAKPQIVVNHRNKAAKEIIVQDVDNKLHLVGSNGKLVWSIPIKGQILGSVHQVDYYGNGRLQYLFNTKEKLYLLDRNGNHVAKFPVLFQSPATNELGVFDYNNNHKYRFFVACENRKVYAYDHEGKLISGWKFGQTNSLVSTPVQHFRVKNKDYIVFKDKAKVYIQNRQGQARVTCAAKFENSNNALVLNTNGVSKIIASDKTGKVFYIYFDGKYAEKKTGKFSENHFFTVSDINGNGVPDFIFVDGKELTVMDEKGKKLFSKKFDNTLTLGANLYSFSAKQKKIGITDSEENEIYLFDAAGGLHQGFPLSGNSQFSIGKLTENQLNLVVGSSEGNLCNYILD